MTRHLVTHQLESDGPFPSPEGCSWRNYSPRHPVWVTDGEAASPSWGGVFSCPPAAHPSAVSPPLILRARGDLQTFWGIWAPHSALPVAQPWTAWPARKRSPSGQGRRTGWELRASHPLTCTEAWSRPQKTNGSSGAQHCLGSPDIFTSHKNV